MASSPSVIRRTSDGIAGEGAMIGGEVRFIYLNMEKINEHIKTPTFILQLILSIHNIAYIFCISIQQSQVERGSAGKMQVGLCTYNLICLFE